MQVLKGAQPLSTQELTALLSYHADLDTENELFANLTSHTQQLMTANLPADKPVGADRLLQLIRTVLDQPESLPNSQTHSDPASKIPSGDRELLHSMARQMNMGQIDQETRHPEDRQQVFYWQHQGELHKGRLRVRHEKKDPNSQAGQDLQFTVQTRTPQLGQVQVQVRQHKKSLHLNMNDERGVAQESVGKERELLAQELDSIGLKLEQLNYAKPMSKKANSAFATKPSASASQQDDSSYLDLRA